MGQAIYVAAAYVFSSASVYAVVIRTILVNVILGAIAKSMAPDVRIYTPPINATVRNSVENRRIVFGTARCGGSVVFFRTTGDKRQYLLYVIVLAGHQVSSIGDVWIDKNYIKASRINAGTGLVSAGTAGTQDYNGKLYIWKYLGTQAQTADATLAAAFPSIWDSNHRLRGNAYLVLRLERDDTIFTGGAPQDITALVNGALLYDPRLDSTNGGSGSHRMGDPSTWAFSRNSALAVRWFLTGGSVVNDQGSRLVKYGLRETDARMDDAYFIAAANKCDEVLTGANATPQGDQIRYTADGEFSTGETRRTILDSLLVTMAGTCTYVQGKWRVQAGQYDAPLHTVTEADLFGDVEIQDTVPAQERYNSVSGVFRDDLFSYVEGTTPYRTNSGYVTQDGGETLPREIDLRGVSNTFRAQRLCEIELRKSRNMRTISLLGGTNLLKIAQNETFSLTIARFGWSGVVYRCVERQFEFDQDAGRVKITAQVENSSIWTDLITADYIMPNSTGPIVQIEIPYPPSALTTQGQQNGILLKWTPSNSLGVIYEVEESTASTMTSPTVVYTGADSQVLLYKSVTTTYYYRVRCRKSGQYSIYDPNTGTGVSGAATNVGAGLFASASPSSATSSASGASQTTGSVTVTAIAGTAPYTYAWTWLSGGTGITINSTTAATTTFGATGLADGEVRTGTARCTVTDNAAATKTVDVAVSITRLPAMTVSISPAAIDLTVYSSAYTTTAISATPTGGTGPYTYAWTWSAGGTGLTINSPSAASTTVTFSGGVGVGRTGTLRCTVNDSAGHTNYDEIDVSIYHDTTH